MKQLFLFVVIIAGFTQCKKDDSGGGSKPVTDARTVLLKDVIVQGLPNPWYHFEYDADKYMTRVEFSSGQTTHLLQYTDKRLSRVLNAAGNRVTKYTYTGLQVSRIDHYIKDQLMLSIVFSYDGRGLVQQIDCIGAEDNGHPYKRAVLSYLPDSNVSTIQAYQDRGNGLEINRTSTFSNYDDGVNVDDLLVLEDFLDILVVLPQVRLQRNNPRLVTSKGNNSELLTDYQYEYNAAHLPVKRTEHTLEVKGQYPGHVYDLVNTFSYY